MLTYFLTIGTCVNEIYYTVMLTCTVICCTLRLGFSHHICMSSLTLSWGGGGGGRGTATSPYGFLCVSSEKLKSGNRGPLTFSFHVFQTGSPSFLSYGQEERELEHFCGAYLTFFSIVLGNGVYSHIWCPTCFQHSGEAYIRIFSISG